MKQRQRRKDVQRRMREAPGDYALACQFYDDGRWDRIGLKKIAGRPVPAQEFNQIPPFIHEHQHAINRAMADALTRGTGWLEMGIR